MTIQSVDERLDPIEDLTGDLFVNRREELALFWQWATNVPHPMRNSWALIGRRRTGKTAILVKLFNRLFWEQEKVLPVFVSFAQYLDRKEPLTGYDFAHHYIYQLHRLLPGLSPSRPALVAPAGEVCSVARLCRTGE